MNALARVDAVSLVASIRRYVYIHSPRRPDGRSFGQIVSVSDLSLRLFLEREREKRKGRGKNKRNVKYAQWIVTIFDKWSAKLCIYSRGNTDCPPSVVHVRFTIDIIRSNLGEIRTRCSVSFDYRAV